MRTVGVYKAKTQLPRLIDASSTRALPWRPHRTGPAVTRLVLHCSVAMAWCSESEADRYADAVLEALVDGAAVVPALWPLEVANVLVMAERRRRLSRADAMRFLERATGGGG